MQALILWIANDYRLYRNAKRMKAWYGYVSNEQENP